MTGEVTTMDAMTILRRCRDSGAELSELDARIRQRRDAVTALSVSMDRDGGRGPYTDRLAAAAAAVADLENQAQRRMERQAVELLAVNALAERLPGVQGRIIYLYYGKAMTVRATAKQLKYSEGYTRRMRREAEEQLRQVPPEEIADLLPPWYE